MNYPPTSRCSKCKKDKPRSSFHVDRSRPSRLQRYCKECKKRKNEGKVKGQFIIYYLPKERYVGMTKNYSRRIASHRKIGRNTKYAFIILKTKKVRLAHLVETFLHIIGFNGFRY
jgi:hypothetical protein